jgi:hypothetical protein
VDGFIVRERAHREGRRVERVCRKASEVGEEGRKARVARGTFLVSLDVAVGSKESPPCVGRVRVSSLSLIFHQHVEFIERCS